jgi:hypothetical protein
MITLPAIAFDLRLKETTLPLANEQGHHFNAHINAKLQLKSGNL